MLARVGQLEVDLGATRKELHEVHQANHHHWQQWESTKQELETVHHANHNHWQLAEARHQTLSAVYRSLSWRITAPLRFAAGLLVHPGVTLRNSVNHAVHCTVESCQRPLSRLMAAVLRRPKLAYRINQVLMRYPALYQQLIGVARRQGVVPGSPHHVAPAAPTQKQADAGLEHLSPHARQVYADLKTAIEKNKRSN
jgi:O-antigen chain-terminating methyltransferase